MKVIYSLSDNFKLKKTAVAIGIFDGMHRGHQYLLKAMLAKGRTTAKQSPKGIANTSGPDGRGHRGKALRAQSVVITFFPHPAHVLRPDIKLGYLVSLEHRLKLLERLGVEVCIVINFTKKFARIEPEAFIRDTLVKRLGARAIFVGEDFHFGRNRAGDVTFFEKLASVYGYEMCAVPALTSGGGPVSSTRIRKLVTAGRLAGAQKLLGRPFSVLGKVVRGSSRGRDLGFPTANIEYSNDVLPPNGVYAVQVIWKNRIFKGAANLGLRPSFKEKDPRVHLEVYILDFHQDLYGQTLEVQFIKRIRSEKKFSSSQELVRQIQKDVVLARQALSQFSS